MLIPPVAAPLDARTGWFTISLRDLERNVLWLTMALSGFILFEPAPFEFMVIALIGIWLISGLHIPRSLTALVALTGVLSVTGLFAALLSTTMVASGRHVIISIFLYALTIGLAAFIARDPKRALPIIMNGHIAAALLACAAGIIGYFGLADGASDLFLKHGRARGTMKDPNVFGPFLVVPIIYIFVKHLLGRYKLGSAQTVILLVLCFGILLSFSRGAWGNLIFSAGLTTYLLFISVKSNNFRVKIIGLTACIAALSVALLAFAMNFEAIASLMNVRGHLIQSYDTNERFAGAQVALDIILQYPLGIGATSFNEYHEAEPHNVFLYAFLIGGWIGGFAYICLVLGTIYVGLRNALSDNELRTFSIVFFSTFLAVAIEGLIVDTDHWRHFYILMACNWGLYAHRRMSRTDDNKKEDTMKHIGNIPELAKSIVDRSRETFAKTNSILPSKTQPTFDQASSVDLAFKVNRTGKRNWRRKLGHLVQKPNNAPRHDQTNSTTQQSGTNKRATLRLAAISRRSVRTTSKLEYLDADDMTKDRTGFGARTPETFPERTTFGRRTMSDR